eukprot:scaffold16194_cov66-Phaeocystis_antarctica.AAC.4
MGFCIGQTPRAAMGELRRGNRAVTNVVRVLHRVQEAAALQIGRHGEAGELHECRVHVHQLDEGVSSDDAIHALLVPLHFRHLLQVSVLLGCQPRRLNDERDAGGVLKVRVLGPQAALAKMPAVVAKDGNDSLRIQLQLLHLVQHRANVVVGCAHARVVHAPAQTAPFRRALLRNAKVAADTVAAADKGARGGAEGPVGMFGRIHLRVHVHKALGDVPRRVWPPEPSGDEKRLLLALLRVALDCSQRVNRPIGQPTVVKLFVWLVLWAAAAPYLVFSGAVGAAMVVVVEVLDLAKLGASRPRERVVVLRGVVRVVDLTATEDVVSVALEPLWDWENRISS